MYHGQLVQNMLAYRVNVVSKQWADSKHVCCQTNTGGYLSPPFRRVSQQQRFCKTSEISMLFKHELRVSVPVTDPDCCKSDSITILDMRSPDNHDMRSL